MNILDSINQALRQQFNVQDPLYVKIAKNISFAPSAELEKQWQGFRKKYDDCVGAIAECNSQTAKSLWLAQDPNKPCQSREYFETNMTETRLAKKRWLRENVIRPAADLARAEVARFVEEATDFLNDIEDFEKQRSAEYDLQFEPSAFLLMLKYAVEILPSRVPSVGAELFHNPKSFLPWLE
jgi:hypothetical protein